MRSAATRWSWCCEITWYASLRNSHSSCALRAFSMRPCSRAAWLPAQSFTQSRRAWRMRCNCRIDALGCGARRACRARRNRRATADIICFILSHEAVLPPGLECHHGHGVGEVEAALTGAHGQFQVLCAGNGGAHGRRQALAFRAEHEPVARPEVLIVDQRPGAGGEGEDACRIGLLALAQ